ncbi:hypothetical protein [Ornithinimicrobium cryptoxanthini]|uniref:Glycosyl hydrolase n=1 Tax=Ornithinimicrobium cryptoxanthini TaxID=2934161 RepID=A0ABY4YGY7_9MICO|nr:hypothetical protein [Ornithinimicrobium cryptoxanthini]USQ75530.1 hypothetical protein NF557_13035 [Ornithinimicrobium cryptoxanthini]
MPRPPAPTPATERAAARVVKRGRSRDRTAYNAVREGGVAPLALHAALEHHLDERPARGPAARAEAGSNTGRWVPIGPSVIRRGQAVDRPHVVGRIRDLAVSEDGERAYAASAKGGLWHTDDAGATWAPIGTWAGGNRRAGGNTSVFVCGSLLVDFGPSRINDFVMVGTGELSPGSTSSGAGRVGGVGVLTALGPAFFDDSDNPWEPDTGIDLLEGEGIFRLARRPGRTSGTVAPATRDEVLAATSDGLFLGVRRTLPAAVANPPFPALEERDGFEWSRVAGIAAGTQVTDVVWIETAGGTRIIVLVDGQGLELSDDDGASFTPVPTMHRPGVPVEGRCSISIAEDNRAYVLYGHVARPAVRRIPDLTAAVPTATRLTRVPRVWDSAAARDYDQAIAAEAFDGTDRIYLGGNTVQPRPSAQWSASLWAMDVVDGALRPRPGVSDRGAPPAAGADRAGLVGNNVHADVHAIALPGPASTPRPVWVACDGGVYVSTENGRVNSFAAVNSGLSVSETGFLDHHPVASHFVATGLQDNGTAVRTGDTVWEVIHVGDGGGLAFAPTAPDVLAAQYIYGYWRSTHVSFRDPLTNTQHRPSEAITNHPENSHTRAEFYANCAVVRRPGAAPAPDTSRLALGTDRVYVADNIASGSPTQWVILPVVPATEPAGTTRVARNPHAASNKPPATFGTVPGGAFGRVVSLAWIAPDELVVIYAHGILRQTEVSAGRWSTEWLLDPGSPPASLPVGVDLTEIAAVPGSRDFYVTTTGDLNAATPDTAYFFNATTGTFHATGLRTELGSAPLGPLDPAYSVAVDPGATATVYVGTATGVWRGTSTDAAGGHDWDHFANGLPEATVQDLSIWTDPAGGAGPRLLRAAIQSRGVWETDLAADTPVVTYVRCHSFDDRRGPLPAQDPRASATALSPASSPDIGVRPAWPVPAAPPFPQVRVGSPNRALTEANAGVFNTWTFQTAFRWWYPSVRADGQWTDAFRDLIQRDRQARGMSGGRTITRALWEAVVGNTRLRLDNHRLVRSTDAADDLAVFRPPWQTALSPDLLATEVDIMECIVPTTAFAGLWSVPAQPSVVEVLLHHRASEPTTDRTSYAGLLWKEVTAASNPLTEPAQDFVDWWDEASELFGDTTAAPPGWTVVRTSPPASRNVLDIGLDARLPRAMPIPLDLTPLAGKLIVLAAFSSSLADNGLQPAPGGAATLTDLVRSWPHVAVRLVQVV